jgi:fibronectin type 3 domain-containing protein
MGFALKLKVALFAVVVSSLLALSSIAGTLPAVPTGVTATPGNSQVTLRWSAASSANSYRVMRSTKSGGPYTQIAAPDWIGFTDVSVDNGTTYYYVILSADSSGESGKSAQVSARPTGLAAPGGVAAKAGNSQVSLTWSAVSSATSYRVDRATKSGGPYTQIASPTWHGYTDMGADNGTTYYYVILAANSGGASGRSAQVSAKPASTVSGAPTGLTAQPGNGQVVLRWSAVSNATSYHLKRSTSSNGTFSEIAAPTWEGYTDTSVTNGDTYYYAVSAITSSGESANSSEASAKPANTSSGLPTNFFNLSWSALQASHFPSVPFGGLRAWDTATSWAAIETSSGHYNWSTLDARLELTSSRDKDVMYTFGFVPHWGSMRPSEACAYDTADPGCAAPPSDVDSGDNIWKSFVTAIVKHSMSSPNLHIAYYEMWNEPDLTRNWSGTPAQLVIMERDAYTIIHQLDPSAKLIGPSPSTANQYGVHFLPSFYAAGGAAYQDIVGMHAYVYDGAKFSTSPLGVNTSITQLKLLMSKYGISSKPIWFTEGNWGDTNDNVMSNAQKAAYVAQEHVLMWASGAVSRFYWFSWDAPTYGTLWTSSSGVLPAGVAYERIATWLIGSTHSANPCGEGSDGTWTCNLKLSTGYPAQIIWNPETSKTIPVSSAYATYETVVNSNVGSITGGKVNIGNSPILIIESQAH